jgi:hypothetical protein
MTAKNIERSSSEPPSHVDVKVTSNFISNIQDLKSQYMPKNISPMIHKDRKTRNMSITYDVSTARKIRIAKYTAGLLF